jgi:hypothetical protein
MFGVDELDIETELFGEMMRYEFVDLHRATTFIHEEKLRPIPRGDRIAAASTAMLITLSCNISVSITLACIRRFVSHS